MASIGRASALLASGTVVSRVLGFVKTWLLLQAIGTIGFSADAYATSTIVPTSIYAIVAQGLLNAILVPQIVRASSHPDGGRAFINKLVTLGMLLFGAVALAATLLAPVLTAAFGVPAESAPLATAFAYWSLPQIFFLGLYTLLGEVLNARKSFGPFSWAPVLSNVVGIGMLAVFIAAFGADSHGDRAIGDWSPAMVAVLAGGITLGMAVQAVVLFLFWRRVGLRFRFDLRWRGVELGAPVRAAGWTFAMVMATQVAGLAETIVANSATGHASTQTIATAWTIFVLPQSIITISIVIAFYTRLSEYAHEGDLDAFRHDYSTAVRTITLLITVSCAYLVVVAFPFSRVLTPDYAALGMVLIGYLVGLLPASILSVTQRAFYALGDTRTPFLFTCVQVALVVAGVLACFAVPVEWRAAAITLVVSIGGTVQSVLAAALLRPRIGGLDGRRILASQLRNLAAGAVSAGVGVVALALLGGTSGGFAVSGALPALLTMIVVGVVMVPVYGLALWALRSPELGLAVGMVARRLRRTPGDAGMPEA